MEHNKVERTRLNWKIIVDLGLREAVSVHIVLEPSACENDENPAPIKPLISVQLCVKALKV